VFSAIIRASIGSKVYQLNIKDWPIIFVIQFLMICLLLVHLPFAYYIGKENIMMLLEEYSTGNLSMMIDRVKNQQGDPRFFLVELRKSSNE